MVGCIFTLDYEIYGNGRGSLEELVLEPAERLRAIFREYRAPLVVFVEAAEFEVIEALGLDPAAAAVGGQIAEMAGQGFEIALHIHPQWYNAMHSGGEWRLDASEYNMCVLSAERIGQMVDRSIAYLRSRLGDPDFTPCSFRAGNWLLQPTGPAAGILASRGVRVDSSVFKGGLQRLHGLDYRKALGNGYAWMFSSDVNIPDAAGPLLEVPIFSRMVSPWRMATSKRLELQARMSGTRPSFEERLARVRDRLRPRYPLKLDFCRMTAGEFTEMVDEELKKDERDPSVLRPLVAIGHTKDLTDPETVGSILAYLRGKKVPITTLRDMEKMLKAGDRGGGA